MREGPIILVMTEEEFGQDLSNDHGLAIEEARPKLKKPPLVLEQDMNNTKIYFFLLL